MTSAASYFNKSVLRKDLTRFAPVWILAAVLGAIILPGTVIRTDPVQTAGWLQDGFIMIMVLPNLLYGFLCAALLFGDLYTSRLCYALHAMPLKREGWFLTHVLSGLLYMLIPYGIAALLTMIPLGSFWPLALQWLLGVGLQYVFFFGLSVFCIMLTGNAAGLILMYGLFNGISMLIYCFLNVLYMPLLPGLTLQTQWFARFCPVLQLLEISIPNSPQVWIFGAAGLVLLGLALLLYRKRQLEKAGDFLAVSWVKPLFLLVYTLGFALVFHLLCSLFLAVPASVGLWSLVPGTALGWATGLMLLDRSLHVFTRGKLLSGALLLAVLMASLGVTRLDPLDLVTLQPEPEEIVSVSFSASHRSLYSENFYEGSVIPAREFIGQQETDDPFWIDADYFIPDAGTSTDPRVIQAVLELHKLALEAPEVSDRPLQALYVAYRLQDGSLLERRYRVPAEGAYLDKMVQLFSAPEFVLGYDDWDAFLGAVTSIQVGLWKEDSEQRIYTDREDIVTVLQAVKADCEAGILTNPTDFCYLVSPPEAEEELYSDGDLMLRLSGLPGGNYRRIRIPGYLLSRYEDLIS